MAPPVKQQGMGHSSSGTPRGWANGLRAPLLSPPSGVGQRLPAGPFFCRSRLRIGYENWVVSTSVLFGCPLVTSGPQADIGQGPCPVPPVLATPRQSRRRRRRSAFKLPVATHVGTNHFFSEKKIFFKKFEKVSNYFKFFEKWKIISKDLRKCYFLRKCAI